MAKPNFIELGDRKDAIRMPILFEDRSVFAIDKSAGWMLVPFDWQRTQFNLQAAITSALRAGFFWSKSRNLKFLQHIHRLDAETTGVLLFGKSPGAVETISELFESRKMHKCYLAVVEGVPKVKEWVCHAALGSAPRQMARVIVDPRNGKEAETAFRVVRTNGRQTLVEARPVTGRTHQIRVHLQHAGHPVVGDELYGTGPRTWGRSKHRHEVEFPLALRAIELSYQDPFQRKPVLIQARTDRFLQAYGFSAETDGSRNLQSPEPDRSPKQGSRTDRTG